MNKYFSNRYVGAFAAAMLLLSGVSQIVAPALKWSSSATKAYAQSGDSVRLSRRVIYDNANSPDQFRDDRIDYRLTLENQGPIALTGPFVMVDGHTVDRVMVTSAMPAGTYLAAYPTPPTGWQVVYSTNSRQQTGQSNSQVGWTTARPSNIRQVRRIAFIRPGAVGAYEIVDGLNFGLRLTDLPAQASGVRNITEVYAAANGMPGLIASDENFYSDIDGIELAAGRSGKPTADVAEAPAQEESPVVVAELPAEIEEEQIAEVVSEAQSEPAEVESVAVEPPQTCSFDAVPSQFSVGVDSGSGGTPAFPSLGGFFPVTQVPGRNLTYVNGLGRLDDFSDLGGNVMVGHRFYNGGGDRIYGGYLAYDLGNTGNNTFNQLGVGLESLGQVWDGHLNLYLPLEGRQLVEDESIYEDPLTTVEAEVAAKLLSFANAGDVRAYLSPYYYTEENSFGGRVGLTAEPIRGVSVGTSLQVDDLFDTQVAFNLNYRFGGSFSKAADEEAEETIAVDSEGNPCDRLDRIDAPIRRTAPVRVQTQRVQIQEEEKEEEVAEVCATYISTTSTMPVEICGNPGPGFIQFPFVQPLP